MAQDYAVMAKVNAMYGRRLSPTDYDALLHKTNVAEIASYLKQETAYREVLGSVRADTVHRGQLEALLRRRKLDIYQKLTRYSRQNDTALRLFFLHSEVDLLMAALRRLGAGSRGRLGSTLPAYLARYLRLDLFALAAAATFEELLTALSGTPYREILLPFHRDASAGTLRLPTVEARLLTDYYQQAFSLVDGNFRGDTRKELRALLTAQAELYNLTALYRMKGFPGSDAARVEAALIHLDTPLMRSGIRKALLEAGSPAAVLALVQDAPILGGFALKDGEDIEQAVARYQQKESRRRFRFSAKPAAVLLSFMILLDIEIANLFTIIEGIRYEIPPEEIRTLLVIPTERR